MSVGGGGGFDGVWTLDGTGTKTLELEESEVSVETKEVEVDPSVAESVSVSLSLSFCDFNGVVGKVVWQGSCACEKEK